MPDSKVPKEQQTQSKYDEMRKQYESVNAEKIKLQGEIRELLL